MIVGLEQRPVGREAEVDFLADLGAALARVGDRLLQDREVEQRLAAEERDVRHLVVARFLEHELHALARGLLAHELGLLAVLGVDDLVLAVLVAVGAAQVALVGDVEDHRRQRERREREDLRRRRAVRHRARSVRRSRGRAPAPRIVSSSSSWPCRSASSASSSSRVYGRSVSRRMIVVGGVVQREDGSARHEVDERLACRLEPMMFPRGPADHLSAPGREPRHVDRHRDQQVRARAKRLRRSPPSGASSATTQTSPTLFRLPLRFVFGPSTVRREQTLLVDRADKLRVVVAERGSVFLDRPLDVDHSQLEIVGGAGLAVRAVDAAPMASNCWSCFGNTAPPTRAIPASGTTLMPSIRS